MTRGHSVGPSAQIAIAVDLPPIAILAGDDELSAISLVRALRASGVAPILLTGGRRRPIAAMLADRVVLVPAPDDTFELREALLSLGVTWRWRFNARTVLLATDPSGAVALAKLADELQPYFSIFGDSADGCSRRFTSGEQIADGVRSLNQSLATQGDLGPGAREDIGGQQICCWVYRSRTGHCVVVTVEVHRTHHSRPTAVATIESSSVRDAAERAVCTLGLRGFVALDFAVESTSNALRLIDIVPHWTAPMELGAAAGLDFVRLMLDDFVDAPQAPLPVNAVAGRSWIDPWTDICARSNASPVARLRQWLADVRAATVRALWIDVDPALLWRWVLHRPRRLPGAVKLDSRANGTRAR